MGVGNLTGYDWIYQSIKAFRGQPVKYRGVRCFQRGFAIEFRYWQITQAIYNQQRTFVM